MGELALDSAHGLDTIIWNVYGKVWKIKRHNGDSIKFTYDTKGDRIEKEYIPLTEDPTETYYVRDAQGNILNIYTKQVISNAVYFSLTERDIYGSKRIGTENSQVQLINTMPGFVSDTFSRYLGTKNYEMDNHLGNVLATVSDRKIPISLDTTTRRNKGHPCSFHLRSS